MPNQDQGTRLSQHETKDHGRDETSLQRDSEPENPAAAWRPEEAHNDLIKESFHQVLDATKHQDDKIGRFLTAVAFLTTGAIALLYGAALTAPRFSFAHVDYPEGPGHGVYPLVAWASVGFFLCVFSAVSLLLISLTAPLRLPGRRTDWGPSLRGSRLFFTHIADEPADDWNRRWHPPDVLDASKQVYEQYVNETHNLAERARVKYQHTNEAGSLFILALLILGLLVVLTTAATLADGVSSSVGGKPIPWSWRLAWPCGLVICAHVLVQLHGLYVQSTASVQLARDAGDGMPEARVMQDGAHSLRYLLLTIPVFVLAVMTPGSSPVQRRVGGCVAAVSVLASLWWTRRRWARNKFPHWPWARLTTHALVPIALAVGGLAVGGVWQLCVALVPSGLFAAQGITAHYRRSRRQPVGSPRS